MAGEIWTANKTNWVVEGVPTTFFNRIEANQVVTYRGGGLASADSIPTVTTAENLSLDIGETYQTLKVNGSTQLRFISTTGRQPGNVIHLIKTVEQCQFYFSSDSPPSNTLPIITGYTGIYQDWLVGRLLTFVLSDIGWHYDYLGSA